MKKLVSLLLVVVAVIAFNSCGKKTSPEAVATDYLKAVNALKFDEAKKFVTEESKATIDFMAQMTTMGGEEAKKKAAEAKIEIKDMKCETKDDAADCTCKLVSEGKEEKEEKIHLVKKDGKWLVEQKKEGAGTNPNENAEVAPADSNAVTTTETTPTEETKPTEKKK